MRNTALEIFENRMDILVFAAYATKPFSVSDVFERVIEARRSTIRNCLNDLVSGGYLIKQSIYLFEATDKTKQLFRRAA